MIHQAWSPKFGAKPMSNPVIVIDAAMLGAAKAKAETVGAQSLIELRAGRGDYSRPCGADPPGERR